MPVEALLETRTPQFLLFRPRLENTYTLETSCSLQDNVYCNCCATFMVHRDRVKRNPRVMYEILFNASMEDVSALCTAAHASRAASHCGALEVGLLCFEWRSLTRCGTSIKSATSWK